MDECICGHVCWRARRGTIFDGLNSFRYISDDVAWWLITELRNLTVAFTVS